MLILVALTPLCHMNQLGCGSSAIYAWPVDTSFECSKSVCSSVDHGGTLDLDIALGCSISGDIS